MVDHPSYVLITGADSGIGRATVSRLAHAGYSVLAACYNETVIWDLAAEAHQRVQVLRLDVTSDASCQTLAEQVTQITHERGLFALVNNAGIALGGPQEVLDVEVWSRQLNVNVLGTVRVTRQFLPLLRLSHRPRIVNISSICGLVSFPFVGPYCASKHAIEALTVALRGELRPFGIQVTTVAPGLVNTPLWDQIEREVNGQLASYSDDHRSWYADRMNRRLQRTVRLARSGLTADAVAIAVLHAVRQPRLQARYLVGRDARLAYLADRLLPRHAWLRWLRHKCGLPV